MSLLLWMPITVKKWLIRYSTVTIVASIVMDNAIYIYVRVYIENVPIFSGLVYTLYPWQICLQLARVSTACFRFKNYIKNLKHVCSQKSWNDNDNNNLTWNSISYEHTDKFTKIKINQYNPSTYPWRGKLNKSWYRSK